VTDKHKIKKQHGAGKDGICDSIDLKSIAEFRGYSLGVCGAKKDPDSVEYGIHWLRGLKRSWFLTSVVRTRPARFTATSGSAAQRAISRPTIQARIILSIDTVRYALEDDRRNTRAVSIDLRKAFELLAYLIDRASSSVFPQRVL
jgi:hypothetical protein